MHMKNLRNYLNTCVYMHIHMNVCMYIYRKIYFDHFIHEVSYIRRRNHVACDLNDHSLPHLHILCMFSQNNTIIALQSDFIPQNFPRDRLWIYVLRLRNSPSWVAYMFRKFELTRAMRYMFVYTYVLYTWATRDAKAPFVCAFSRKR